MNSITYHTNDLHVIKSRIRLGRTENNRILRFLLLLLIDLLPVRFFLSQELDGHCLKRTNSQKSNWRHSLFQI